MKKIKHLLKYIISSKYRIFYNHVSAQILAQEKVNREFYEMNIKINNHEGRIYKNH